MAVREISKARSLPPAAKLVEWHTLSAETVLENLSTTPTGLTTVEVARRLQEYGTNTLQEARPINPLVILFGQFKSLVVWLLIGAGVVSGIMGEWIDSIAIIAIVILNALIGFFQEYKAERAIAALKSMTAPRARAWRDGQVVSLAAVDIVPGDVIGLEAGDLVPADARLLEAASLKTIEAALTGESDAVRKREMTIDEVNAPLATRQNMVFMGTSIAVGTARAVVTSTGMATEFGRIAGLLQEVSLDEGTPLQKRLTAVGRLLVWVSLGVVGLIFSLGLIRGAPLGEMLLTSISLAVAAVPEGLPAVVTVALALGVQRMARRRALVRKLPAVETLGSTNVICTDKTGTLTVGEMTVRRLYVASEAFSVSGEGYGPDGRILGGTNVLDEHQSDRVKSLLTILVGCTTAHLSCDKNANGDKWSVVGDPTEGALLTAGMKSGVELAAIEGVSPKISEFPFDSDRKRMTVVRRVADESGSRLRAFIKGAPDVLLDRCTHILSKNGVMPINERDRLLVMGAIAEMAEQALRVVAGAYRDLEVHEIAEADDVERGLIFVGLCGMLDPPREEVKDAVARCRSAGIRVVMITGDHPSTALAIAKEVGIGAVDSVALTGPEIEMLSDGELKQQAPSIVVYARVSAEHKLRIVRAWRTLGGIIAMTGDGVNDAPAIKGADIGIAMGKTGTEVTKEASDMVITDDNFASIVAAVEEGRGIYDNIKKTLQYLLAGNLGELLLMTAAVALGVPVPLLPIHLLWINLVTDGLPALALATDPIDADVMKRPPHPRDVSFADRQFFITMTFTGILTATVSLATYLYVLDRESLDVARTSAFAVLVYAEVLRSFGCRSETKGIWSIGLLSNAKLAVIAAATIFFQPWTHHFGTLGAFLKTTNMSWSECLVLLGIGAVPLLALETMKSVRQRRTRIPA
jgi:P-type Ca2+ transporter type 2C